MKTNRILIVLCLSFLIAVLIIGVTLAQSTEFTRPSLSHTYSLDLPEGKVTIGNSKAERFEPHIEMEYFNGENKIEVWYETNITSTSIVEGDKAKWETEKLDINFYGVEDPRFEGGALELEVILNEKPTSNLISLRVDDGDQFNWFKQELASVSDLTGSGNITPYCTSNSTHRVCTNGVETITQPLWVINSYALYHKNKKDGEIYKTGKAFHIPRGKMIDSANKTAWIEDMNYSSGILTFTLPQGFLNTATYPIRHAAGTTWGYTTIGGTTWASTVDRVMGSRYAASAGTVASITVYIVNGTRDDGPSAMGIYDSSRNFVGGTGVFTPRQTTGWDMQPTNSTFAVAAANYYIMHWGAEHSVKYDAGGTWEEDFEAWGGPWPDPFSNDWSGARNYSYYATNVTPEPTPTPCYGAQPVEPEVLEVNSLCNETNRLGGYLSFCNSTSVILGNATARGFVWGNTTQAQPGNVSVSNTTYDSYWAESGTFFGGPYYYNLELSNTTYYFRAFANNTYGNASAFANQYSIAEGNFTGGGCGNLSAAGPSPTPCPTSTPCANCTATPPPLIADDEFSGGIAALGLILLAFLALLVLFLGWFFRFTPLFLLSALIWFGVAMYCWNLRDTTWDFWGVFAIISLVFIFATLLAPWWAARRNEPTVAEEPIKGEEDWGSRHNKWRKKSGLKRNERGRKES